MKPYERCPKRERDVDFRLFDFRRDGACFGVIDKVGVEDADEVWIYIFFNTEKGYMEG
jgi:hypothetical protein